MEGVRQTQGEGREVRGLTPPPAHCGVVGEGGAGQDGEWEGDGTGSAKEDGTVVSAQKAPEGVLHCCLSHRGRTNHSRGTLCRDALGALKYVLVLKELSPPGKYVVRI